MDTGLKELPSVANEKEIPYLPAEALGLSNGERMIFSSKMFLPDCASGPQSLRLNVCRRCGCNRSCT
jgi:hypothetical protein